MKNNNNLDESLVDIVISADNPESIFKGLDIPINLVNTSEKGTYYAQIALSDAKYGQLTNYVRELEHLQINKDFEREYSNGRTVLLIEDTRKETPEFLPGYKLRDF